MLDAAEKTALMTRFQRDEKDTGSPEVQIAVLTTRIAQMTKHLVAFPKDFHSRRGLYGLVARRKRLLRYLARTKPETQRRLLQELGIRG
jgi:small subunit ribosomal protein S15